MEPATKVVVIGNDKDLFRARISELAAMMITTPKCEECKDDAPKRHEYAFGHYYPDGSTPKPITLLLCPGCYYDKPDTPTLNVPKVGRNDPCSCGSGKKYKKCHG